MKKIVSAMGYTVGDAVEVFNNFNEVVRPAVVCKGKVERLTKTKIVVRNEHGNLCEFRLADNRMVGYSYPHLTHAVRKAAAAPQQARTVAEWVGAQVGPQGDMIRDALNTKVGPHNWLNVPTDSVVGESCIQTLIAACQFVKHAVDVQREVLWLAIRQCNIFMDG